MEANAKEVVQTLQGSGGLEFPLLSQGMEGWNGECR